MGRTEIWLETVGILTRALDKNEELDFKELTLRFPNVMPTFQGLGDRRDPVTWRYKLFITLDIPGAFDLYLPFPVVACSLPMPMMVAHYPQIMMEEEKAGQPQD